MSTLSTKNGDSFEIEFGGPVSITEGIVFLAKIINSDVDTVHNAFKDPNNTSNMVLYLGEDQLGEEMNGYVRYTGFSVENDGSIIVTLKKDLGA